MGTMTALQASVTARIAGRRLRDVETESGIRLRDLSRLRTGWVPSRGAVLARLASWLGWTSARVLEAAGGAAARCDACGQVVA